MSTAGSGPAGDASSTRAVEALMKECEALNRAIAQARTTRLILLAATTAFVLVVAGLFYSMYRRVTAAENTDRLLAAVQAKLAGRSDVYLREVQTFVDSTSPVITEAFSSRMIKDMPLLLQGVEKERAEFGVNLLGRMEKAVDDHYDAVLRKHEEILVRELPEAKDDAVRARLVANLHVVFERLVKKYYADDMKAKLTAFYDGWDRFPAAETPKSGEPNLEQQLIGTLLEAVSHRLSETSTPAPAPAPAPVSAAPTTAPIPAPAAGAPAAPGPDRERPGR